VNTTTKLVLLGLVCGLLLPAATAKVSYEIEAGQDDVMINTTFELYGGDDTYDAFAITWQIPANATIMSIRDSYGPIEEYNRSGGQIQFSTNEGRKREKETVEIRYRLRDKVQTWKDTVHVLDLQLPGFRERYSRYDEEDTDIKVDVPERVLGTGESFGAASSYSNYTATFQGEGPTNIKVVYTNRTGGYDNYLLAGDEAANLSRADNIYPMLNSITGRSVDFRKFVVIILPDTEYEQQLDAWSAGRYKNGGMIFIKESKVGKDTFTGLLLHETMHGFNQRPLKWNDVKNGLFDEGTAKYVEFLVNEELGVRQAEIFGETVTWTAPCQDQPDRSCRYSYDPRGTPENLIHYYRSGSGAMMEWHPSNTGQIGGMEGRRFGYAYTELLFREYVMENGADSLQPVYRDLLAVEQEAETSRQYASTIREVMNHSLAPCRRQSQQAIETCLDEVNRFTPDVPDQVQIDGKQEEIVFRPVKVPERTDEADNITFQRQLRDSAGRTQDLLDVLLRSLAEGIGKFINLLQESIR